MFDWDEGNRQHLAEHAVTTQEAEEAFMNDPVDLETQEDENDGYRYKQIGETSAGRILILLSTVHGDAIRFVTAFDANKAFKDFYLQVKARHLWNKR